MRIRMKWMESIWKEIVIVNKLEVPRIWSYNYCMMNKIKIGSEVTDGFESGIVVDIIIQEGVELVCMSDGKEAWSIPLKDVVLVDYPYGPITEGDKRLLEQDHSLSACGDQ